MERSGDAVAKLGKSLRMMNLNSYFQQEPELSVSSAVTIQKAAAAKKHIEDHYKNHHQSLLDCSERRVGVKRKAREEQVMNDVEEEMMRGLAEKETEFMKLQTKKFGIDDFEQLTVIGKGAFREMLASKDSNFIAYTFKKLDVRKFVGNSGAIRNANGSKPPSLNSVTDQLGKQDTEMT